MKKIVLAIFALGLVSFSNAQSTKVYRKAKKTVVKYQTQPAVKDLITNNLGLTAVEANLFKNNAFVSRIKKLLGSRYNDRIKYFNVQTPIVNDGSIYKFSGCETHNCANNMTTIFYDSSNDNIMVLVEKNGGRDTYNEKGKIYPSDALLEK